VSTAAIGQELLLTTAATLCGAGNQRNYHRPNHHLKANHRLERSRLALWVIPRPLLNTRQSVLIVSAKRHTSLNYVRGSLSANSTPH
jgi:hypothetical protein